MVRRNLLDAGCSDQSAAFVDQLVRTGRMTDALHEMKVIRCDLMDELHQSQRRVDCLDYLIRQTENFWDDPQKVMYLVDLLFLFDDPDKKQICS
jgi:hypothetical protein